MKELFKTYSESIFSDYLTSLGLFWDYEKQWGSKRPDFTIYSDSKKETIVAVVEIEDIDYSEADKRILKTGKILLKTSDPYIRIRKKIDAAREQLKFSKDYPCLLIINDVTSGIPPENIVLGAMLGDVTFSIPIWCKDRPPIGKPYNFFGKNGKMIDQKGKRYQNTTITAIGHLRIVKPDVVMSGLEKKLDVLISGLDVQSDEGSKKYFKEANKISKDLASKGYDLEKQVVGIKFILNPLARRKFPISYFAQQYNCIYKYNLQKSKVDLIYDWSQKVNKK
jgi:hypothetical protein